MKKRAEGQKKVKELGKKIQGYANAASCKVQNYPLYRFIQTRIGKKRMYWLNISGVLFLFMLILSHCGRLENGRKNHAIPPVPVLTATIRKSDVPVYLNAVGTVTPIESVTIKTQVNGRIRKVHFEEGQIVAKGQLLVEIDPLPYEALLKQYQGQLIRDQALLANARLDLLRYEKLYAQDSVSQQTLETQIHLVRQYEGTVLADQGLVDSAQVDLRYCKIMAEISGMVGLQQVASGNFVQTTDTTPITTVNQLSPTTVVFPIPEDDLGQVREKALDKVPLAVDAFDRKGETILATGRLLAMDSQIDDTTGTIKLKAIFDNENHRLFPNQFVNIRLQVGTLKDMLVAPTPAVQMGRQGPFVYVVDEETKSVSIKAVTMQTSVGGESALSGDLKEGQLVVIQGTDKLSEGSIVNLSQDNNLGTKGQPPL